MTVRTRFAPSPTGFLHVGGARTALFSYLYARHHGGTFILRIEDTDVERSTQESVQAILNGMDWLGLEYDEGPFYQTRRFDRYREMIQQLLESGHAYRCYCSKERLEKLREDQTASKQKPRYDGHCRDIKEHYDRPFVVRFCNPTVGEVSFDDQIRGKITVKNSELDDLIIARTDGTPTYNFCVVIDDYDMKITHVIRGDDHINNTPRQINIFKALNVPAPTYAHVPMILGSDGKRLSKRHGAVSVMQYRDDGYLPQALLNYLVRLGWSCGDQEIFSREEMTKYFDLKAISKSPAAFNFDKLQWLNQHYMKTLPREEVAKHLEWQMKRLGLDTTTGPGLIEIVSAQAERCRTLREMAEKSRCFYELEVVYDAEATAKFLTPESAEPLRHIRDELGKLTDWRDETIHQVVLTVTEGLGLKLGKVAQPIRVALTGNTISPPIDMTIRLMGKDRVLERLEKGIKHASHIKKSE